MSSLIHTACTHITHSEGSHTHTHTHTHAGGTTVEDVLCFSPIQASSPRDSQEQWAASDAAPGDRGPSPSAQSCLGQGQGQDRQASALLRVVVMGFYGGNPGEHGENMQTPHRKAREQAPTCCTMRDLNPQPSCCEATVLRTEPED